eukprot:TRINITY_DN36271_c0_g1_i1.p1 TRINITY_DN36271_c0_g1~~TRINITY_DN36271_c0_g1_i1.p1  ORF type:complete len:373 (-),score=68.40 TRINITY_DN36271_c0_g1_i1:91-1143(-)
MADFFGKTVLMLTFSIVAESGPLNATEVCEGAVCDSFAALQTAHAKVTIAEKQASRKSSKIATGDDKLLSQAAILMSHDSATGYLGTVTSVFEKVQECGFTGQLSCGVRAFDLRLIWYNEQAHFHHSPAVPGAILPTTLTTKNTLENTIHEFLDFAEKSPDELLILYISHCALAQKANLVQEALPCSNDNFKKIYDDNKLLVMNEVEGLDLKTLTVEKAKQMAKDKGGKSIIIFTDDTLVDEDYDDSVKCSALYSSCESEFSGPWTNYLNTFIDGEKDHSKMQILQAHWQGTGVSVANRDFNQRVADPQGPVMQHLDKVNLLEINWVGDGGKEIAMGLGTKVDSCDCQSN